MTLDKQTYALACEGIHLANLLAQNIALARAGLKEATEDIYGRGLARTILAKKSQNTTFWHIKT
jgi:hypothetical protein